MNTIEIQLELGDHLHEVIIAELDDFGAEGYVQEDGLLKAYIPENLWGDTGKQFLAKLLSGLDANNQWIEQAIQQQDWNEPWEKSIQPIRVGEFFVRPSWAKPAESIKEDLMEIVIDPKMSFGTGHHETTRLVLRELPEYVKEGDIVLDAGVGTAILSIAAVKKGAHSVIGFDIDEWAINNGVENAERNGVAQHIELRQGSFDVVNEAHFDVIFANINLNVLLNHTAFFASKLNEEGYLILSGVLRKDVPTVKSTFESAGFYEVRSSHEGEWYCCVLSKKEQ